MFTSIADIKRANNNRGHFWFSPDTMAWFRSRIETGVINGQYFISSEQYDDQSPRLYTIRQARPDGSIETIGEFQKYETLQEAIDAAKQIGQEPMDYGTDTH